jgi:uncharacterized membrane protein YjjP (DUF1212 family)
MLRETIRDSITAIVGILALFGVTYLIVRLLHSDYFFAFLAPFVIAILLERKYHHGNGK